MLSEENDEIFLKRMDDVQNSRFTRLCIDNKTRWRSDLKMGRAQLKNNCEINIHTFIYFLILIFNFCSAIVKRCLEIDECYDLILTNDDLTLLSDYVNLLKNFEVFTSYIQAENYPTMNSIILFRVEIIQK